MKKITLIAAVLIFGLSFGINIAPSYATDIAPANQTVGSQDTQALNSQLESMKSLLLELQKQQARQTAQPIVQQQTISISSENILALQIALDALKNTLIDLQLRLKNDNLTLEQKNAAVTALSNIAAGLMAVNSSLGSQNLAIVEVNKISQQSPISKKSEVTAKKADEESLFENQTLEQKNEQTASLNLIANLKKLPLPAIMIGLAVITAIIMAWLFVMRNKEPKAETSKA